MRAAINHVRLLERFFRAVITKVRALLDADALGSGFREAAARDILAHTWRIMGHRRCRGQWERRESADYRDAMNRSPC